MGCNGCSCSQKGRGRGYQRGGGPRLKKFARGVRRYAPRVKQFVKRNRLVSRGLTKLAPNLGEYAPLAMGAAAFAKQRGWGRYPAGYSRMS